MCNELQRPFITPHSFRAIEREIEMAEALIEHDGTAFPDSVMEDGCISALKFVLGMQGSDVSEEYEDLQNELKTKADEAMQAR